MNKGTLCVDIGSENTTVFLCKDGDVNIVLSGTSQRSTPSLIAFPNEKRLFGDLVASVTQQYENVCIHDFKGLLTSHEDAQINEDIFKPEEILSYFIEFINKDKEQNPYDNVCFAIPMWWSERELKAFKQAVEFAKIKNPSYIFSNVAHAFDYCSRTTPANGSCFMLNDFGAFGSDTSVFKFTKEGDKSVLKLISYRHVNVGGEHFTYALANSIFQKFEKDENPVIQSVLAKIKNGDKRLWRIFLSASRNVKESLIKGAKVQFKTLALTSDADFIQNIEMKDFEVIDEVYKYRELIAENVEGAYDDAKKVLGDEIKLEAAESNGGNGRFSYVKEIVENATGKVTAYLNTCESVAEGAGFYQNLRDEYRVEGVPEITNKYPETLTVANVELPENQVFVVKERIDITKSTYDGLSQEDLSGINARKAMLAVKDKKYDELSNLKNKIQDFFYSITRNVAKFKDDKLNESFKKLAEEAKNFYEDNEEKEDVEGFEKEKERIIDESRRLLLEKLNILKVKEELDKVKYKSEIKDKEEFKKALEAGIENIRENSALYTRIMNILVNGIEILNGCISENLEISLRNIIEQINEPSE